jgi:hypothetical protein
LAAIAPRSIIVLPIMEETTPMSGHDREWQRLLDEYAAARNKFEEVEAATTGRFRQLGARAPLLTDDEIRAEESARNGLAEARQRCYAYLRAHADD